MAARIRQETWALVMEDAQETCKEEVVTLLDTSVAKRKRASECSGVEKPTDPQRYHAHVLPSDLLKRQFPGVT
jgi:hypothetical protein